MPEKDRRSFLRKAGGLMGATFVSPFFVSLQGRSLLQKLKTVEHLSPETIATDEELWRQVRLAYTVSPSVINLNNGGVSPQPKVVQEAMARYNELSNEAPSYYMWRVLDMGREPLRRNLARLAGCSPDELAINRNASEALETVIFGLRLQAGDEVVLTKQDYPNMIHAWKQRELRDGIKLRWLSFDFPIEEKQKIVDAFSEAFSSRTKVVHITHMINWNGQLLPVKEIAREAHRRGIEVLVDAAHTFAHLDYRIPELECDYWGTSLHKWLCAPFGTGMLYVKKEKIAGLYPLFGAPEPESDDIRKFEHLGTRSFPIEQAIGQAIQFHEMIGPQRKEARLRFLKDYWTSRVSDLANVHICTPGSAAFSGAIALVRIEGTDPGELANTLFAEYKIHTTSIDWENIQGVRVTPNVYTSLEELDVLVEAIRTLAQE